MLDIPEYETLYAATPCGRIFSKRRKKILETKTTEWYSNIRLCKNGVQTPFKVHRLIALCYIPNPNNFTEVNHKNGIKSDNRPENLEWCSRSENIKHAYAVLKRTRTTGAKHPKHRPILDLQTGIYYDSSREVAEAKGVPRQKMLNDMKGKARLNAVFV